MGGMFDAGIVIRVRLHVRAIPPRNVAMARCTWHFALSCGSVKRLLVAILAPSLVASIGFCNVLSCHFHQVNSSLQPTSNKYHAQPYPYPSCSVHPQPHVSHVCLTQRDGRREAQIHL